MTLSPVSTRMRFLRILPAVWAMMTWSLATSFTRKVALGSNSSTIPSNSSCSSFAISPLIFAAQPAADCRLTSQNQGLSGIRGPPTDESATDTGHQPIAHLAIGGQLLFARAFHRGGVQGRPIFDNGGSGAGEFHRLVLRFGGKRDHQVERAVFQILKPPRLMGAHFDADLVHHLDGQGLQ